MAKNEIAARLTDFASLSVNARVQRDLLLPSESGCARPDSTPSTGCVGHVSTPQQRELQA
jgi:hypothetical protein